MWWQRAWVDEDRRRRGFGTNVDRGRRPDREVDSGFQPALLCQSGSAREGEDNAKASGEERIGGLMDFWMNGGSGEGGGRQRAEAAVLMKGGKQVRQKFN
jgi:hypothetical protein